MVNAVYWVRGWRVRDIGQSCGETIPAGRRLASAEAAPQAVCVSVASRTDAPRAVFLVARPWIGMSGFFAGLARHLTRAWSYACRG